MKKISFAILILAAIAIFAYADYYTNLPGGIPTPRPSQPSEPAGTEPPTAATYPNILKQALERTGLNSEYTIEKRTRSTEIFEVFNLSKLANLAIFRNILISEGAEGHLPIYAYEVQGPAGQGSITYLNIKLAMVDKIGSEAGINETGDIGYNNLFYNDEKNPSTGFLLTQVEDTVFGFRYDKSSPQAFDFIKRLVNNYMQSLSNNT